MPTGAKYEWENESINKNPTPSREVICLHGLSQEMSIFCKFLQKYFFPIVFQSRISLAQVAPFWNDLSYTLLINISRHKPISRTPVSFTVRFVLPLYYTTTFKLEVWRFSRFIILWHIRELLQTVHCIVVHVQTCSSDFAMPPNNNVYILYMYVKKNCRFILGCTTGITLHNGNLNYRAYMIYMW